MERLASLPFSAQPGERWVYGYNTDILGCVIEKASGTPLDAFLKTRILDPLDMRDTSFFLPAEKRNRLAAVYSSTNGALSRAPEGPRGQGNYVDGPRRSFAGGAGLLSTTRDYSRFLEMIRNGGALGGVRILAPRTVALMTHNQIGALHSPNGLGYGLGFETTDRVGANGLDPVNCLRVGRRVRLHLSRRSERGHHDPADDPAAAAEHRPRPALPDAGASGVRGRGPSDGAAYQRRSLRARRGRRGSKGRRDAKAQRRRAQKRRGYSPLHLCDSASSAPFASSYQSAQNVTCIPNLNKRPAKI